MLVLITYDLEDDTTRTRLAHKLKDFGRRVQYSVFEADISEQELAKLRKLLARTKLGERDSIRLYRICAGCVDEIQIWGYGEVTEDKDYYIV